MRNVKLAENNNLFDKIFTHKRQIDILLKNSTIFKSAEIKVWFVKIDWSLRNYLFL